MTGNQLVGQGESIAQFAPSRLPWHPAIEEKFGELGVNRASWKALTEAVYPAAKTPDAVVMALSYCAARKLDPFKRPVHIVPMWDSQRREMVETVWPGISEIRTTAFRTGQYAGCDEVEFGPMTTKVFVGKVGRRGQEEEKTIEVRFPEWGRINVYRILNGQRCKFVSPKVYWLESYGRQGASDVPNDMWAKRPSGQLEKCVEAAGLRKAFPEEIGNDYAAEEMAGQVLAIDTPAPERAIAPPPPAEVREAISGPATGQPPVEQKSGPQAPPKPEAEDAEFVETPKPEPTKEGAAPAPEAKVEGPSFDVPAFLEEAETLFAGCRTEAEVSEAHDMLADRVEEFLSRPQRDQYDELQAAALKRIATQTKPGTLAAPGPADDDEDEASEETMPEPPPHEVAASKLCQALNNCEGPDDVNAVWNEQKGPLRALVKEGLMAEEFRKALFKLVEQAHAATVEGERPNVRLGPAPAEAPAEKPAGGAEDDSELAQYVDEFRAKIEAAEDTNALNTLVTETQERRDALKAKHGAAADAFKAMITAARKRFALG